MKKAALTGSVVVNKLLDRHGVSFTAESGQQQIDTFQHQREVHFALLSVFILCSSFGNTSSMLRAVVREDLVTFGNSENNPV